MSRVLLSVRTSADVGSTFGGTTLVSSVAANFPTREGYHIDRVKIVQNTTVATTAWTILRSLGTSAATTLALFPGAGSSEPLSVSVEIEVDLDNVTGFDLLNGSTELAVWVYGG